MLDPEARKRRPRLIPQALRLYHRSADCICTHGGLDPRDCGRRTSNPRRPDVGRQHVPEWLRRAYGPNYARLRQLKTRFDPTNFFHVNQNIRPSS